MSNEIMKVRYPFHGFYRKLLQDEGYAEDEPIQQTETVEQTQTALAPADTGTAETGTCDTVQEDAEQAPRYVADVIGDDFKTWGPGLVAIEASTGTGKTSFVLNQMLDWAEEQAHVKFPIKQILYLCNRIPLKKDILRKLSIKKESMLVPDGFGGFTCAIDDFRLIHIQTYQYYEKWLCSDPEGAKRDLQDYRYIVCDEAHYFVDDASFNQYTGLMYDLLMELSKYTTVIFMTATPGVMFKSWRRQGKLDENRYYCLYRKSDWITKAVVYQKDQLKAILDAIPADEKAGVFVKRTDRLDEIKSWYGDDAGCYCSENNEKEYDDLKDCIKDGKLQRHIVAATQVLYNGIDIKDTAVKHIIIEDYEPTKVIQEIGRKRSQGTDDPCTVYFRELTPRERSGLFSRTKYVLEVAEAVWERKRGDKLAWVKLAKKGEKGNEQIKYAANKKYISFDFVTGESDINRLTLEKLREQDAELREIQKVGYWQFMQEKVWGKILNVEPQKYVPDALIDYIKNNMGNKMSKADIQNGLVGAGLCAKVQSVKKLNVLLEPFEAEIVSGTEWERKNVNYGKVVYWLRER